MGRGDDSKLSLDHIEPADDEAAVRHALARWGEPTPAPPPPALAARVQAALAEGRPVRDRPRRPRRAWGWGAVALLTPLVLLGLWGVVLDSTGPAELFGNPDGGLAQLMLLLTLAAKPLVNTLLLAGPFVLTLALSAVAAAWLWWRTVRSGAVEVH
jgi:ABC-type Fe3+ transport system permease subunit